MFAVLMLLPMAADPPLSALQDQVKKLVDTAEPGIAAVVVSTNPNYPALTESERTKPGFLGGYSPPPPATDGIVQPERNRLDLSDPRNAAENGFGSGLVLDKDGRLLTCYHLIENARKIYVRYSDGRGFYANIHSADARSDLAVLKPITKEANFKPVKLAAVRLDDNLEGEKANVVRGQFAVTLAHPFASGFADGKASASWGLVSNVRRRTSVAAPEESRNSYLHQFANLIQTDARLNLGASGGALLNLDGEVIGLLTATAAVAGSEASGGYAMPMDPIYRRIVEVLKEGREIEYGFLGVQPGEYNGAARSGLPISRVSGNTPAFAAGLQDNDILQAVDGRPIREKEDLYLLVGGALAGTEIALTVQRGREKLVRKATLAKYRHELPSIATVRPDAVFGLRVDHTSLLAQLPVMAAERRAYPAGVLIRELVPGSPAAEKLANLFGGKTPVITKVNGAAVATPDAFYKAAKEQTNVSLVVVPADRSEPERVIRLP